MGNNHVSEPGEVYLTKLKATAYFYFRCFSIYKQVESVLNLQRDKKFAGVARFLWSSGHVNGVGLGNRGVVSLSFICKLNHNFFPSMFIKLFTIING